MLPRRLRLRALAAAALLMPALATLSTSDPASADQERPGAAASSSGDRANLVAKVARRAGITPAQARRAMADPASRVEADGTVWFADDFDHDHGHGRDSTARTSGSTVPRSGARRTTRAVAVPGWHSRPGARSTIFLDVQPVALKHTWWNDRAPVARDTYAGWSLDRDPALSERELVELQEVWRGTAEAFAAFDVDVTTERPDDADLVRSGPEDERFGSWVVLSSDPRLHLDACAQSCAGVAFLGTFGRTDASQLATPALIFNATSEVVAHEVGHQLGLSHDGAMLPGGQRVEYHRGTGAWSPIMGSGLSTLTQWSPGDYPGATNPEDDYAVMEAHGLAWLADEAPAAPGPSSPGLPGAATLGRADVDVFAVLACAGTREVVVDVVPGSGLDADLELLDAAGRVLVRDAGSVTANDGRPWGRTAGQAASAVDASGQVAYARVSPGSDDRTDGYSAYGAVGAYRLSASCDAGPPAPPTGVTAVPTGGGAVVSWSPPPGPVTGYDVRLGNHTSSVAPGVRTALIPSFGSSGEMDVTVTAKSSSGSSASAPVTVRVPAVPPPPAVSAVDVDVDRDEGAAAVRWTAPDESATLEFWRVTAPLGDGFFLFEAALDGDRGLTIEPLPTSGSLQVEVCGRVLAFQHVFWDLGCRKSDTVSLPRIASTPNATLSITSPSAFRPAGEVVATIRPPDDLGEGSLLSYRYALDDRPWVTTDETSVDLTEGLGTGWHRLRVQAVTTAGAGQTALFTFGHTRLPSQVRDLTAETPEEPGSLVVAWRPPADADVAELSGYRLEVWSGSSRPTLVEDLPSGQTSHRLTGLAPGRSYYVVVSAMNEYAPEYGTGPQASVSVTMPGLPDELRPDTPSLERVALAGERNRVLAVRWVPAASGGLADTMVLRLRGTSRSGDRTFTISVAGDSVALRTKVPGGYRWQVRIRASGPGGTSPWSAWREAAR